MKTTAVSGDLLVKIGIGAGLLVIAYVLLKKAGGTAAAVADKVGAAINPASPENIVNQGVTSAGRAISGNDSWTLGGWLYDITHDDPVNPKKPPTPAPKQLDQDVLKPGIYDGFGTEIYPYP